MANSRPHETDPFMASLVHHMDLWRRERGRGGKTALAKAIKVSTGLVGDVLAGRTRGSERTRRAMAAFLGFPGPGYERFLEIGRRLAEDAGLGQGPEGELQAAEDGHVLVPVYERARVGSDGRLELVREGGDGPAAVYAPVPVRFGRKPLRAFRVLGGWMEPLIAEGGVVVAEETALQSLDGGGPHVLCLDLGRGALEVRIAAWASPGGSLVIASADSIRRPPFVRPVDDVAVIGRVVWSSRPH
jgi:hypothetical protein